MSDIEKDEIITLHDEDGNEINFVVIDGVEYKGKTYLALVEEEHYDDEECEFTVLRVDEETEGEECVLASIEDEKEFEAVLKLIEEKLDDENYLIEDDYDLVEDEDDEEDSE